MAHMEPKNGGSVQMTFLFKRLIFRVPAVSFGGSRQAANVSGKF